MTKLTQIECALLEKLEAAIELQRFDVANTIADILVRLNMINK